MSDKLRSGLICLVQFCQIGLGPVRWDKLRLTKEVISVR